MAPGCPLLPASPCVAKYYFHFHFTDLQCHQLVLCVQVGQVHLSLPVAHKIQEFKQVKFTVGPGSPAFPCDP